MPKIWFYFNGFSNIIECREDEKIIDIYKRFIQLYFGDNYNFKYNLIYNDNKINENLSFKEIINLYNEDKDEIVIIVYRINNILINDENELEKFNDENDAMILKYKFYYNINVKIFGNLFVSNNIKNCIIIYNGKKYKLTEYLDIDNEDRDKGILELKLIGVKNIINMSYMFENTSLFSFNDISKCNYKYVNNMAKLFGGCSSLSYLSDISKWEVSNVTDMFGMFIGCSSLLNLPDISKWNTINVLNMSHMFSMCYNLISLPDISKWNTMNVREMSFMFCNCKLLISLPDISGWNTINVQNMTHLFCGCSSLILLPDISKWNISNTKDISYLFFECLTLTRLPDISKWNTSNVTNIDYLFGKCVSLLTLPNISKWNTNNIIKIRGLFDRCFSLSCIPDISLWNLNRITNSYMFYECINLINN